MEEHNRFKLEISEDMLELREFRDEMREDNRYEAEEIPKSQAEINEELYGFKSVFKEEFVQFRSQNDEQMADIHSKLHAIMDLLHEIMKSRGLEPPDLVGAPLNQLNSNPVGSTLVLAADQLQADDNAELGLDITAAGNPVHDKMLKNTKLIDSEEIKGNDSAIKSVEDGNNFNEMLMPKSVGKDEGIGLNEGNVVDGGVVLSLIDLQQALGSLGDTTVNSSSNGSTKAWFEGATSTIEVVLGQNAIDDTAHYLFDELPRPFLVEQSDRNAGTEMQGMLAMKLMFFHLLICNQLSSEYEATVNGSINGSTKAWFEEEKSIMEVVLGENAIEDDAYKVFDEMTQTIRAVLLNEQVTDLYTNDVNFNKLVLFDPGGGGNFVTCLNKGAFRPLISKDQRTCVNGMERVVSSVLFALSIMPSRDTHCLVGSNYFYLFSCGTHAIIALIVDNIVHGDDFTEMDLTALFEEVNSQLLMKVLSFDPGGFSLPKVGSDPLEFKGDKGEFRLTTIAADILVKAITHKCRIPKVSVCGVVVLYPQKLDGEVVYYIEYIRDHIVNYLCVYKAFQLLGFEVLCKKGVTEGSMREFIATFFGSIPKKCGNEELCDEATDETSDNAVKLFVFIYDWVLFVYCDWIMFAWLLLIDKSASDKPGVDILTDFPQHGSDQFMSKTEGMVVQLTMVCCVIYSSSICSCMSEFVKLLCTRELPMRGRGHDCIQHLIAQNAGSIDMVGRFFLSSFDYPLANQPSWIESKGFDLQDTVDINDALSDVLVIVQTNGYFMFV